MADSIRVLQIVGDSKYGGATYLILSWCKYLIENGQSVTLLTTDNITIDEARKIDGIKIVDSILIPREIDPARDLAAAWHLHRLIRNNHFNIVHTHTSTPGFVGRLTARLSRTPVVLHTAHGWPVTESSGWISKAIFTPAEYLAGMAASAVICVSHATAHQGRLHNIVPCRKVVTICNGIDPSRIATPQTCDNCTQDFRCANGIDEGVLLIGTTGRLAPQKDHATLIRSIPFLKRFLPDRPFLLVIAGEGPEKRYLESLTESLGLVSDVRFLGFCADIPGFLAAIDVFVSASLWEGLSISLLEAMAAAKPVVATNILPNAELIDNANTGLLIPTEQPQQLAKAVAQFVVDADFARQCGIRARRRVMEEYTIERMFRETCALYNQLLGGHVLNCDSPS